MPEPAPYAAEDAGRVFSLHAPYASTVARSPRFPAVAIGQTLTETTGPTDVWGRIMLPPVSDLTRVGRAEPLGQRIIVTGRVLDDRGRPVSNSVVEVWQCNAAGRYIHERDAFDAPLDPNFVGEGRVMTDDEGRYRFVTIRPGAYPWRNHHNAWRPAHIHFSLFGPAFATRLVTQMYFPDDPLIEIDPIANAVPRAARDRMVSRLDMDVTTDHFALGYSWDIVLRGRMATPMEEEDGHEH